MTAFTSDAAGALGGPEWLVTRRRAAGERLAGLAMPAEAEEIWRYSGIDRFDLDAFAPVPPSAEVAGPGDLDAARRLADSLGPRSALVVTSAGAVVAVEPAPGAPEGLVTVAGSGPLSRSIDVAALGGASPGASPDDDADAFEVLHAAFTADVVLIRIEAKLVLEAPIVVVHLDPTAQGDDGRAPAVFSHTVVHVGRSAEAGVIELLASAAPQPEAPALVVPVSELVVDDDGRLSYANLQLLGAGTTHIARQASRVGRDGRLHSLTVGLGGSYARVCTESDLTGSGGSTTLLAAYLGTGGQVHDFRTLQDHHAPQTDSELLFTGAVADSARSVYSGLIRIRRGARRADARQTNNNLVLSEGAHADSVPNLDIDENDVRCSHASTVGPIDEEQRYYLESRGVEPAAAERLIVRGFFSDLAQRSPFAGVRHWIEQAVEERLIGRLPAEQSGEEVAVGAPDGADRG